jgi:hypothetical protein
MIPPYLGPRTHWVNSKLTRQAYRGEDWDYTQKFDYIHTRVTLGCWSDMKSQIIQKAYDNLQPGGWFEAQEILALPECDDGTMPLSSPLLNWALECNSASVAADRILFVGDQLRGWLEEVGFVDVHEMVFRIPVNGWPRGRAAKYIGHMWQRNILNGVSGFTLGLLHRVKNRTLEDIEVSLVPVSMRMRAELWDSCRLWM